MLDSVLSLIIVSVIVTILGLIYIFKFGDILSNKIKIIGYLDELIVAVLILVLWGEVLGVTWLHSILPQVKITAIVVLAILIIRFVIQFTVFGKKRKRR